MKIDFDESIKSKVSHFANDKLFDNLTPLVIDDENFCVGVENNLEFVSFQNALRYYIYIATHRPITISKQFYLSLCEEMSEHSSYEKILFVITSAHDNKVELSVYFVRSDGNLIKSTSFPGGIL